MPYSAGSPRKCQGCGKRKPPSEFTGKGGRICPSCRKNQPSSVTPLGDGTAAVTLLGKHAHGRFAYVSIGKVPLIEGFRWRVQEYVRADGVKCGPYAVTKRPTGRKDSEMVYMHRLITGYVRVDHENRYPLDNTDENLRDATQSQNGANRGKRRTGGTSKYKGVRRLASGSWQARIKIDYEQHTIGSFAVEENAARAYDAVALAVWGKFALTNERLGLLAPASPGSELAAPLRRHGNGALPPDLVERLPPELRATIEETTPDEETQ